jgi:hypothetical protein
MISRNYTLVSLVTKYSFTQMKCVLKFLNFIRRTTVPLKKVNNYSSKMSYALDFDNLQVKYSKDQDLAGIIIPALGVKTHKGNISITYGDLSEFVSMRFANNNTISAITAKNSQETIDWFLERCGGRYGIDWKAKLSGDDDIFLANSNSMCDYKYYYHTLDNFRDELKTRGSVTHFEGWYQNA